MGAERGTITSGTTLTLWVAAGARCEFRGCNRYLLEDGLTGYELNLAERAHVVGATEGARSPRGGAALEVALRNEEENLMLLCRDHHRLIDTLVAEHAVGELLAMKREHEKRIRLLTGLSASSNTVVLRMIGGIRGAPVEVGREAVRRAVIADGRYPDYRAALAGEDVEIDLRGLPAEADPTYWKSGEHMIVECSARLRGAQDAIPHLSVFALARLPFLVALGYHLDDKVSTTIYPRQRGGTGDGGWGYDPEATPKAFALRRLGGPGGPRVTLAVSLTAAIGAEVLSAASQSTVYEIEPDDAAHSRELFSARGSLDAFAETYHDFLAALERDHPDCEAIDLYLAAPAPAAVQVGRGLMRDAHPALVVFDRGSDGLFHRTLALGGSAASP